MDCIAGKVHEFAAAPAYSGHGKRRCRRLSEVYAGNSLVPCEGWGVYVGASPQMGSNAVHSVDPSYEWNERGEKTRDPSENCE